MLYGNELLNEFNRMCKSAKHRFWVVSPFLGTFKELQEIIGNILLKDNIDIKLITDIENSGGISKGSLLRFLHLGQVKTLSMLHAKIYIIDNKVLVTSANLSKTAFKCRYEIGNISDLNEDINQIFQYFWNTSTPVTIKEIENSKFEYNPNHEHGKRKTKVKTLWKLNNNKNCIITNNMIKDAYIIAKEYYYSKLTLKKGKERLGNKGWNLRSANTYIWDLKCMLQGKRYTQTMNEWGTEYYLKNIYKDFGKDSFDNAINAYKQHVKYNRNLKKPNKLSYAENLIKRVENEAVKMFKYSD